MTVRQEGEKLQKVSVGGRLPGFLISNELAEANLPSLIT